MQKIKRLIEKQVNKTIPNIRQRGNRYVLGFRNELLEKIFKEEFHFKPGPKSNTLKIPKFYKNTDLEKYYWLGLMDGDGIIAQNARKIALEMCNKQLVIDFQNFLKRNNIITKLKEIKPEDRKKGYYSKKSSFLIIIKSSFYDQYANLIGFSHPRKQSWLIKHLNNRNAYTKNNLNIKPFIIDKNIIDYTKIFKSDRVYVIKGKEILKKYNVRIGNRKNKNIKFIEIYKDLKKKNVSKIKFLKEISKYRLKMSKGSTNSVKIPLYLNKNIIDVAKFIRLGYGNIILSRQYIKSFNINPEIIITTLENLFDIKAKYDSNQVPMFCSGILKIFFSKITSKDLKERKLPIWYKEVC